MQVFLMLPRNLEDFKNYLCGLNQEGNERKCQIANPTIKGSDFTSLYAQTSQKNKVTHIKRIHIKPTEVSVKLSLLFQLLIDVLGGKKKKIKKI